MFKGIPFKRTALLSIAVCFTLFFVSLPRAMSLDELDAYCAACPDECCNLTGGSNCVGDGYSQCGDTPWYLGGESCPLGWDCDGRVCLESEIEYAPSGPDNADCDNGYFMSDQQTCTMDSATVFCSKYQKDLCIDRYDDGFYYHFGVKIYTRYFKCVEDYTEILETNNNSKLTCHGDECWW